MYVIKSISFYAKIPSTSYRNLYALYRPGNWYSICNEMMHHPSDSVVHFTSVDFRCALDLQNRVVLPFDRLMARHWLVVQYTCKSFTFSSLFQFLIFPTNRRHRYKTVPCSDIKTVAIYKKTNNIHICYKIIAIKFRLKSGVYADQNYLHWSGTNNTTY